MKKYMDGLAKKHYDNDDENGYDKIKQVYREHRLLSLSSKGLLEVAAFKVFLNNKLCVRNCLKRLLARIYFLFPAPLCVRLLCPTKSLSRRLTRNLSCTSQLLEQCRLQRGEIVIFSHVKHLQDSKKSEVISMQWQPRVMLSNFD